MKVTINGEEREFSGALTIAQLLETLGTIRNGIAVARNEAVVRRAEYDTAHIADGDRIEIIKAVAGG